MAEQGGDSGEACAIFCAGTGMLCDPEPSASPSAASARALRSSLSRCLVSASVLARRLGSGHDPRDVGVFAVRRPRWVRALQPPLLALLLLVPLSVLSILFLLAFCGGRRHGWWFLPAGQTQVSMKDLMCCARRRWRSRSRAFASICRMRSRVTANC